jgi:glyoxylase I family protein
MSIAHVLAVVPVTDLARSRPWYESLFGRPADNNPMPNLVEWQVVPGGWVQVFIDAERAGSTLLNFAVDDLEAHVDELKQRGLALGQTVEANKACGCAPLPIPTAITSG